MKKKILSLAIAAVTFSSLSAFAQATTGTDCSTPAATACCDNTKKCCKEGKKGHDDKKGRINPFANLNLTAEQQTKLDALRAEQQASREKARAEAKQKMEARKQADKGKTLTDAEKAARKAECDKAKADQKAEREAARQAYLDKVKAILTPEQYEQFTQDMAKMHDSKGPRHGHMKGHGKDGRKGGKGHGSKGKGPRGNKSQTATQQ